MDSYDYEYHRSFTCNLAKEDFIATETVNNIDFHFCVSVELSEWMLRQHSSEPEFVRLLYEPVVVNHVVSMSREEYFSNSSKPRRFVEDELVRVDALQEDDDSLMELVDYAFLEASRSVTQDYHAANGVLNLHFDALTEHRFVLEDEYVANYSFLMIPAADSSVEGLKRAAAAGYVGRNMSCSICLEEFSGEEGGGNDSCCLEEALLSMPCSHVFHGDCIKKWLSVSHYCPLCRLELPTSTN